jgi:hypothetical protein
MIITYTALCAVGLITSGCSSLPFGKKEEPVSVPQVVNAPNIPQWFFDKETDDINSITVTATDVSKDMQFAIDKATLNAKIQIAAKLKSDINSLERESVTESGYGVKDVEREVDRVSKVKINQAIGFFKRENIAVVKEGDNYRAFVKFKISVEDARRLTQPKDKTSREDKFKELDEPKQSGLTVEVLPPQ